jgi:hypothetical protein
MVSVNVLTKALTYLAVVKLSSGLVEPKPVNSHHHRNHESSMNSAGTLSRRAIFSAGLAGLAVLGINESALAFENKISTKYDDRPKQRGSKVRQLFRLFKSYHSRGKIFTDLLVRHIRSQATLVYSLARILMERSILV